MSTPWWQQAVMQLERAVGPDLEALMKREDVALAIAVGHTVQAELARLFERNSRRVLHLFNLPAGSDVNRLLAQIALLEHQVRELTKALEADDGPAAGDDLAITPDTAGETRRTGARATGV